jgi:hypothetical protein
MTHISQPDRNPFEPFVIERGSELWIELVDAFNDPATRKISLWDDTLIAERREGMQLFKVKVNENVWSVALQAGRS